MVSYPGSRTGQGEEWRVLGEKVVLVGVSFLKSHMEALVASQI